MNCTIILTGNAGLFKKDRASSIDQLSQLMFDRGYDVPASLDPLYFCCIDKQEDFGNKSILVGIDATVTSNKLSIQTKSFEDIIGWLSKVDASVRGTILSQ